MEPLRNSCKVAQLQVLVDMTKFIMPMKSPLCVLVNKEMGNGQTVVCVKGVKQEASEEWDESMPLPGDIIEGFAEDDSDDGFQPAKARAELSSNLRKIRQSTDTIWVKVRRGDGIHKLCVHVVSSKNSILQKKYTIKAARDDRHIAVLGDLTLDECTELQEMSRRMMHVDSRGFKRTGVKYDWKKKVGTYLPDPGTPVISSIIFMPLQGEFYSQATIARSMAWFSAAISSGVPLVFVNVQTEQIINLKSNFTGKGVNHGKQQNQSAIEVVQGIRLWFLPGVAEVLLKMTPELGETRFGLDIKRTDEGFICVHSVTKGFAADRAGLRQFQEEANAKGQLVVMSRLGGKSVMPSSVGSEGLINCCDHNEIRETLVSAIDCGEGIQLHFMAWPSEARPSTPQPLAAATLRPPKFPQYCDRF